MSTLDKRGETVNRQTFYIYDNDLAFNSDKNLIMVDSDREKAQSIERALTTHVEEWFVHNGHGLDYNHIFARPFDEERARLEVVSAISQDPRIKSVGTVSFTFDQNRSMRIDFTAVLEDDVNPTTFSVSAAGYVAPVVDYRVNTTIPEDHHKITDPLTFNIDLGFITDEPVMFIDWGSHALHGLENVTDYGMTTQRPYLNIDFGKYDQDPYHRYDWQKVSD